MGSLKNTLGARCISTGNQSISSTSVTAVTFGAESFDSDVFHDNTTNNTRLTIQSGLGGEYIVSAFGEMDLGADDFARVGIRVNGSSFAVEHSITTGTFDDPAHTLSVSTIYDLSSGDYIEMTWFQNSGGALTLTKQSFALWKLN